MASYLRLFLKTLSFIGIVLTFLFILDIFSLVFTINSDPRKDWKFLALMTLIVCVLTFWGTDSKSPTVLAYSMASALITLTLYYTIEMDDILSEFSDLTGSAFYKALGLRILVLIMATIILAMITGYRMGVLLEHVLRLSGHVTMSDVCPSTQPRSTEPQKSQPLPAASRSTSVTKSATSKSSSVKSKASPVEAQNVQLNDDGTAGDWDDEDGEEEDEEEETSPSDVHRSAKSFNSQFLERPSSRITGSTVNSSLGSVSSKPSPTAVTMDGVPTKSSN